MNFVQKPKDSVVDDLKTCKEAVDEIKKKVKGASFEMEEEEGGENCGKRQQIL